eukprot:jgi/Mesen1/2695/ME000167S01848
MLNRLSLDRFKKAESAEPFNVTASSSSIRPPPQPAPPQPRGTAPSSGAAANGSIPTGQSASAGGGASTWQPPEWATDPRPGAYVLEVIKDGVAVDSVPIERKRAVFGRQAATCDFVLDHPSVSRQHAAVVHHKNGSVFVIDMGSVHGTFVSNERLKKDVPVELEAGQSLRFAASTRTYVLRKAPPAAAHSSAPAAATPPAELPAPPDPADPAAVLAYNTILNRLGVPSPATPGLASSQEARGRSSAKSEDSSEGEGGQRPSKRAKTARVSFSDQYGGELAVVVGVSDGADVSTEPGPIGVREGSSLVGKFDSLVQTTIIPKSKGQGQQDKGGPQQGKDASAASSSSPAVTDKLKQYLSSVRSPGLYGGLLGDSQPAGSGFAGGSWSGSKPAAGAAMDAGAQPSGESSEAARAGVKEAASSSSEAREGSAASAPSALAAATSVRDSNASRAAGRQRVELGGGEEQAQDGQISEDLFGERLKPHSAGVRLELETDVNGNGVPIRSSESDDREHPS